MPVPVIPPKGWQTPLASADVNLIGSDIAALSAASDTVSAQVGLHTAQIQSVQAAGNTLEVASTSITARVAALEASGVTISAQLTGIQASIAAINAQLTTTGTVVVPAAPTAVHSTATTTTTIAAALTAPASGAVPSSYQWYYRTPAGSGAFINGPLVTSLAATLTGLLPGTSYGVSAASVNSAGVSAKSAEVTIVTPAVVTSVIGAGVKGISPGSSGESNFNVPAGLTLLQAMAALGCKWMRIDITWSQVQSVNAGTFDWAFTDACVANILAAGLKPLLVIAQSPGWAGGGGWNPPTSATTYGTFCGAAAARYAAQGCHWFELWNEPNLSLFWNSGADTTKYGAMLTAGAAAIHAADPLGFVVSGGLAPSATGGGSIDPVEFLTALYANGSAQHADAIGWHPYCFPNLASQYATWSTWSKMSQTPTSARSLMIANGDTSKKIWMTEFGAPTDQVTEAFQASMVNDAYNLAQSYSWAGPLFWFDYQDNAGDGVWGLIRADGSSKPSAAVYASIAGPVAPSGTESPDGTAVTTAGPTINASPTPGVAGLGNVLAITSGGQISLNGVVIGGSNVVEIFYKNHTASQKNAMLNWYGPITATSTGNQISDPTVMGTPSGTVNYGVGVYDGGNGSGAVLAAQAGQTGGIWPLYTTYNEWNTADWGVWATFYGISGSPPYAHLQCSPYPMSLGFNASDLANNHQADYNRLAQNVAAFGNSVISISIGWEWNSGGAWDRGWDAPGMQALYIQTWRAMAQAFKTYCPNVIRVWAMNHIIMHTGRPEDFYPGDDVVDAVGLEVYEQWIGTTGTIDSSTGNDFGWIDNFTKATFLGANHPGTVGGVAIPHGGAKYIVFAEWQQDTNIDPNYITKVFAWANDPSRVGRMLIMVYWNMYDVSSNSGNLMTATNQSGQAFIAAMRGVQFNRRIPTPRLS